MVRNPILWFVIESSANAPYYKTRCQDNAETVQINGSEWPTIVVFLVTATTQVTNLVQPTQPIIAAQ